MNTVDAYLKNLEPAKRRALERIRAIAKAAVPGAEETISYKMPTLKVLGKPFLGFNAHTNHVGLYPYSGSTIRELNDRLKRYELTTGAVRVPYDDPISETLLRALIAARVKAIRAQVKAKA